MSERLYHKIAELQEQLRLGSISRRDFLRYAALLGLSVGAAEALAACAPKATPTTAPTAVPPPPTSAPVGAATSAPPATTAPTAPPPTAAPPPAAPAAQGVQYPGYAWNPPYAGIWMNYDKCIGCRICEGACSIKNFGVFDPELSRIKIHEFYGGIIQIPATCWGCRWGGGEEKGGMDAPCVAACPTTPKALIWHETLNVPVLDEKVCIKCGLCYDNCAQKNIHLNPKSGFPNVCTRCDGDPECVKACMYQALEPRKTASGVEYALGSRTLEQIAQDLVEHKFYPWVGLEDWKKVGV